MTAFLNKRLFGRHGLPLWVVLLIGLAVLCIGLGLRSPWPADEPRFVLIAREMLTTGNWLFPHRAGQLYPDKPPVFFWTLAFCLWLTHGTVKVAHLLPALASGLACLAMVYDLSRRLYSRRVATAAALLLLFCLQFTDEMRRSQIDGFLCLWTTLGLYGMCRHLLLGPSWRWYTVAGVAMGIGVITKGVGFLPFLILAPYILMRLHGGWRDLPVIKGATWKWALAPVATLIVIALWLGPMLYIVAHSGNPALEAYRDNILFKQTVHRYANAWHHFNPWWYFLVEVIPPLWFPFSVLLIWLIPRWIRRVPQRDARTLLPLAWSILVLVFFSISHGKRGVYILPALPGAMLAAAPWLPMLLNRRSVRNTAFGCGLAVGCILLLVTGYLHFFGQEQVGKWMHDMQHVNPWPPLITLGAVFAITALWARPRRGVLGLLLGLVGLWLVYGLWVIPQINASRSGQATMAAVRKHLPADAQLAMTNWKGRLVLNADRPVTQFGFHTSRLRQVEDSAAWLLQDPDQRWVLTNDAGFKPCFDKHKAIAASRAHQGTWYLLNADAILPDAPPNCTLPAPKEEWTSPVPGQR